MGTVLTQGICGQLQELAVVCDSNRVSLEEATVSLGSEGSNQLPCRETKRRFKHLLKRTVSIYRWLQAGYNEATFALRHPWGTVGTWLAPSHPAGTASPVNLKGDAHLPPKPMFFPRCPGLKSLGTDSWRTRKTLPKKAMSGPAWSSLQHGHPTLCKLFHFYLISSQDRACQHQNQILKGGLHKMSRAKPSLRSTASEYVEGVS